MQSENDKEKTHSPTPKEKALMKKSKQDTSRTSKTYSPR